MRLLIFSLTCVSVLCGPYTHTHTHTTDRSLFSSIMLHSSSVQSFSLSSLSPKAISESVSSGCIQFFLLLCIMLWVFLWGIVLYCRMCRGCATNNHYTVRHFDRLGCKISVMVYFCTFLISLVIHLLFHVHAHFSRQAPLLRLLYL